MKVDEFLQAVVPPEQQANRDPGDETKEDDFQHVASLTPSGLEVLYSWSPKRLYRLRKGNPKELGGILGTEYDLLAEGAWVDVPSVTTVLGILDKSGALSWWAQATACEGLIELWNRDRIYDWSTLLSMDVEGKPDPVPVTKEDLVSLLVAEKISINHVTNKAADRGTNVHGALESWCVDENYRPTEDLYEEHEQGYIDGLNKFLDDVDCASADVQSEVMVGSLEHGYAGRYDLRLRLVESIELVTKTYPKRTDKREAVDAGSYLIDLKTSKDCYSSHSLQLAAYEQASIECGYGSTDYRAVLRVTADGKYEFRRANAEFDDFKAVLTAYTAMQRKAWFS